LKHNVTRSFTAIYDHGKRQACNPFNYLDPSIHGGVHEVHEAASFAANRERSILWNPKIVTEFTRALYWSLILSQINPVYTKVHLIIFHLPSSFSPSGFSTKILYVLLFIIIIIIIIIIISQSYYIPCPSNLP
jgi:hypothetical protein